MGNVLDVSERSSRDVGSNAASSESEEGSRLILPSFDSVLILVDDEGGARYVDRANQASVIDSIELLQKAVVKKRKESTRW